LRNAGNTGNNATHISSAGKIGISSAIRIPRGLFSSQGIGVSITHALGFSKVQRISNFTHTSLDHSTKAAGQWGNQRDFHVWMRGDASTDSLLALQKGFSFRAKSFNAGSMV
jgi:hypothetical protein